MDDKFFVLWSENRLKGKGKFIFAYGFSAALLTLIVLAIAAFFIDLSTAFILSSIAGMAASGLLFGLILWSRYEHLYQQRIDQNENRNDGCGQFLSFNKAELIASFHLDPELDK